MKKDLNAYSIMQITGEHALIAAENMQEAFNYFMNNQTPGIVVPDLGICHMPEEQLKQATLNYGMNKKINALELLKMQTETCFLDIQYNEKTFS